MHYVVGLGAVSMIRSRFDIHDDAVTFDSSPVHVAVSVAVFRRLRHVVNATFFERYADAYLAFDAHALLPFYHLPSIIADNKGDHVIAGESDLLSYMRPFLDRLEENRLGKIAPEISEEASLDGGASFCSVRYRFLDGQQEMLGDFVGHYVLSRTPEDWRINFAKVGHVHRWGI